MAAPYLLADQLVAVRNRLAEIAPTKLAQSDRLEVIELSQLDA